MTLSDMLGRGVQLEWHEAVAVVRDVIERGPGAASGSIPDFHEVELLPTGHVETQGGMMAEDPVERLVQMLRTLVSPDKPPAQFVELLVQPQESVPSFSASLGYFERPNRAAILQDLYIRASGSSPLPNADELIASLRTAAVPPAANTGEQQRPSISNRRMLLYAAIVLAVVGATTIAVALLRHEGAASSIAGASSNLTSRVSQGVAGVAGAVGDAVSSISGGSGASQPTPAPVEAEESKDQPATTSVSPRSRGAATPETSSSRRSPSENSDLPARRKDPAPGKGQVLPGGLDPVPRLPPEVHVITASDPADGIVYSASSPDVTAPVGVRPHVPKDLPPDVKPEDVARIEIVIMPDGTVGSVKLLGETPAMQDAMLLSAAKAWRFRPATRDGMPVPYRTTVLVAR